MIVMVLKIHFTLFMNMHWYYTRVITGFNPAPSSRSLTSSRVSNHFFFFDLLNFPYIEYICLQKSSARPQGFQVLWHSLFLGVSVCPPGPCTQMGRASLLGSLMCDLFFLSTRLLALISPLCQATNSILIRNGFDWSTAQIRMQW